MILERVELNMGIKTKQIYNKDFALDLINSGGYSVIDIVINEKDGRPSYIFEETPEFLYTFNVLMQYRKSYLVKLKKDEIDLIIQALGTFSTMSRMDKCSEDADKAGRIIEMLNFKVNSDNKET